MIQLPTPALIGVVHLPPLPGTPRYQLSMPQILERAITDARTLHAAGFDAVIVENYGDLPFTKAPLPHASVAAMAIVAREIAQAMPIPVGINALRNDPIAALAIAAASGASFIRVNVHVGTYVTDQGIIEGQAAQTLLYRRQLGIRVAILADVCVKHAHPLGNLDISQMARDTAYRGLADGLIVTGPATGKSVNMDDLEKVSRAVLDRRIFVGSGATSSNVAQLLQFSSGVIVGTSIKVSQKTENPVDENAAREFVRSVRP